MPGRKPKPVPRLMTLADTAGYLGRSDTWFREHVEELYRKGFPKPLPFFSCWDRRAVDLLIDRLGGLEPVTDRDAEDAEADAWLRAANG